MNEWMLTAGVSVDQRSQEGSRKAVLMRRSLYVIKVTSRDAITCKSSLTFPSALHSAMKSSVQSPAAPPPLFLQLVMYYFVVAWEIVLQIYLHWFKHIVFDLAQFVNIWTLSSFPSLMLVMHLYHVVNSFLFCYPGGWLLIVAVWMFSAHAQTYRNLLTELL